MRNYFKRNGAWVANLLAFQLAWLANITGELLLGACASVLCLSIFGMTLQSADAKTRKREWYWVLVIFGLGWLIERCFIATSALTFDSIQLSFADVPIWLLLIWVCFATTFRLSMNYFVRRPIWAFFAGGFASLSYAAGVAMNDTVHYGTEATTSLVIIAVVWAVLFPMMCLAYRYWMSPR